jgi:phage terminase large subunit-like protein
MQFLTNWLDRECGIDVSDISQTPAIMCPASELLARSVETHKAALGGTPVLARHCINAVAAESKAYGRRLASEKGRHGQGTRRIDAAVAAAMAMWAYDNNEAEAPSVWTIDL